MIGKTLSLLTTPSILGLLGDTEYPSIFPSEIPHGEENPCIRLSTFDDFINCDDDVQFQETLMQIDVYADGQAQAYEIADEVEKILNFHSDDKITRITKESRENTFEEEDESYRVQLEFLIRSR